MMMPWYWYRWALEGVATPDQETERDIPKQHIISFS
jgi:hypothetical protein